MPGSGTKGDPWVLRTPPGTSEYTLYRDDDRDPPVLVCQVAKTTLRGRFGMYLPPLLEELGLAELEHNARNNRMRAR